MPKSHKDLPGGSQAWAGDVDAAMKELAELREVVKRLSQNAGLDMSNPNRGVNAGNTPSIKNPVGQKLSSLADTDTYNVAEGQVLSWSQAGQKWLPVTLTTGGTIDISEVSYTGLTEGYGVVTDSSNWAYNAAGLDLDPVGPDVHYIENWTTGVAYLGAGNWNTGTGYALVEINGGDAFGRPYVQLNAEDYADGTSAHVTLSSYKFRLNSAVFQMQWCVTADRPSGLTNDSAGWGCSVYDIDLGIPIWWNGTTWTDALGTTV